MAGLPSISESSFWNAQWDSTSSVSFGPWTALNTKNLQYYNKLFNNTNLWTETIDSALTIKMAMYNMTIKANYIMQFQKDLW